jgi:hypothetical protein
MSNLVTFRDRVIEVFNSRRSRAILPIPIGSYVAKPQAAKEERLCVASIGSIETPNLCHCGRPYDIPCTLTERRGTYRLQRFPCHFLQLRFPRRNTDNHRCSVDCAEPPLPTPIACAQSTVSLR